MMRQLDLKSIINASNGVLVSFGAAVMVNLLVITFSRAIVFCYLECRGTFGANVHLRVLCDGK